MVVWYTAIFLTLLSITPQNLDIFLTQTLKYAEEWTWLPHIVTQADLSSSDNMRTRSTAPMASFTSPFVGMSPAEVNAVFLEHIAPLELLAHRHFVILDKESIDDDSCLIVHGGKDFDPEDETTFLRTDFYVVMNLVSSAELGVDELGEGLERNKVYGVHNLVNF
jgi:hypothetical protein